MAQHDDFPNGTKVRFKAGPRSTTLTEATVTGYDGMFLATKDATGFERKTRPGNCTKV